VCRQRPVGIKQAAWPGDCKNVAPGGKCFAKCKPGYTGPGATARCAPNGWSKPNVQCVATTSSTRTTPKTAGAAAGAAAAAASPRRQHQARAQPSSTSTQSALRMQAPQAASSSNRQVYRCPALPPAVAGATWSASCAGLNAGKVCRATCHSSAAAGYTAVCKASGSWTNPQGAGCGPAGKSTALQESAAGARQAFMQLPAAGKCSGVPAAVAGAVWATCNGVEAGQSCTAACEPGTVGEFTSMCMPGGSW
jgi:hypothetical protein